MRTDPRPAPAVQAEARYLQAVLDASPDTVVVLSRELRVIFANEITGRRLGMSVAELLGRHLSEFLPADVASRRAEQVRLVLETGRPVCFEDERDGLVLENSLTPVLDTDGRTVGVAAHTRDVTAERAREAALRASEALSRKRMELSEIAASGSLGDLIRAALDGAEQLTHSSIGFFHFVDEDQRHLTLQAWSASTIANECRAEGSGLHYPVSEAGVWADCLRQRAAVVHNDYRSLPHRKGLPEGHVDVVRELVVPIFHGELVVALAGVGNKPSDYTAGDLATVTALASMVTDLVERKRAEDLLRQSEDRARHMLETSFDWVWEVDASGRYTFASPQISKLLGYSAEEMIGRTPFDFMPPEEAERVRSIARQHFERQEPVVAVENVNRHKDGRLVVLETSGVPIFSPDGVLRGYRGSDRDVTVRKRAERERERQEAVSRILSESSSLAEAAGRLARALTTAEPGAVGVVWQVDAAGKCTRLASWQHRPPGRAPAAEVERLSAELATLVRDARDPVLLDETSPLLSSERWAGLTWRGAFGFRVVAAGQVVAVFTLLSQERLWSDESRQSSARDLAMRLAQFVERTSAQHQLERFVALSPVVLYALRAEPGIMPLIWVSDNLPALTGFTMEEGRADGWWQSRIHPEDLARVMAAQLDLLSEAQLTQDFRFHRKDGTLIWIRDQKRVVRDANGRPVEIIGSWSDVTREMQLESELRQSQKMDAVGRLSGGIAHDFNNMLTIIQMQTEALLASDALPRDLRAAAEDIASAADRSAGLTRQLLMFSRRQPRTLRDFDLGQLVHETSQLLQRIVGEDIQLRVRRCARRLIVHADQGMLDQVLLNLAVNARDAMPAGGTLFIETHHVVIDESATELVPGRRGSFACLLVRDTGCGIPPESLPHIFEPFFTTKDVGKGTGLGLATVFGIVQQHNGWVDVESEPGRGATFRVFLPCRPQPESGENAEAEATGLLAGGSEKILVVEDEAALQRLLGRVLRPLGYTVLTASSAAEAMETWRANHEHIDLLITDMVMPGGAGGLDLVRALRAETPDLPCICISGYSPKLEDAQAGLGQRVSFLSKPFAARALTDAVRAALDHTG